LRIGVLTQAELLRAYGFVETHPEAEAHAHVQVWVLPLPSTSDLIEQ